MNAVSQVWDGDTPGGLKYNNLIASLTDNYETLSYTTVNDDNEDSGWDFVLSQNFNVPIYGYGKY